MSLWSLLAATPQLPPPDRPQALHLPVLLASNLWSENQRMNSMQPIIIYFGYSDYFFTWILYYYINMNALQSGIASGQLRCY